MSPSGDYSYDLTWSRRNLIALTAFCAVAVGTLTYRCLYFPAEPAGSGEIIPVYPQRVQAATELIDLNTATMASLRRLRGIGPKIAEKIIEYRLEHQPAAFKRPEDITRVKGIGPVTLRNIRPYLLQDGPI